MPDGKIKLEGELKPYNSQTKGVVLEGDLKPYTPSNSTDFTQKRLVEILTDK